MNEYVHEACINKEHVARMIEGLRQTGEVLTERGWIQGAMEDRSGSVCLVGAMRRAFGYNQYQTAGDPAFYAMTGFLSLHLVDECGNGGIVDWNDADGRTEEDVHLLLKTAIGKLEEKL